MKTIVVATDFSASALQAARFAGQIANDQKAGLLLINAWQTWPDRPAKAGAYLLSAEEAKKGSETSLHHLAHDLTKEFGTYLSIRCLSLEGHARAVIREVINDEHADLLVMATVGTAPQSAQLMGSVATHMVAHTDVPLLLIPPGASYAGMKNIMLGIDLASPPDVATFNKAMTFAHAFGSTLNVLCVSDKPDEPATHEQTTKLRDLLSQQPHTLTIEARQGALHQALIAFAHKTKSDLIVLLPQPHNWLVSLWKEGETQHVARLTDIPLLALV